MKRLYSLKAWTQSLSTACKIYQCTMGSPLKRHFGLADQLRRCAISVPANIAEGYGLGTRLQLVRCLRIALGSAYELRCHLEVAYAMKLLGESDFQAIGAETDTVVRLIVGLLKKFRARVPAPGNN